MSFVVDVAFCVLAFCAGLHFIVKIMVKARKALHGHEYTTVPGKWCGAIPYQYKGENRVLYILNSSYTSVDDEDMRVYGITRDRCRINITPPPGYQMTTSAYNLGFESVEMVVEDDVRQFPRKTMFTFPPQDEHVNEYPLHAQ
jgi:hypothetical protein